MELSIKNIIFEIQGKTFIDIDEIRAQAGDLICVVGPSHSGKSLLLGLIAGALHPFSGRIEKKSISSNLWKPVGYRPESLKLDCNQTVGEYLIFICGAKFLGTRRSRKAILDVLDQLSLYHSIDKIIGDMSPADQNLISIAGAVIGEPDIVIIDEAYDGLDDSCIWTLNRFLTQYAKEHLVILSSRNLMPTPRISCYWMIVNGAVRAIGSRDSLMSEWDGSSFIEYYRSLIANRGV